MNSMTSTRPYFVRAIYEWLEDNQHTPYLLVDATQNTVTVPEQYVKDGRIVLNISSTAVRNLYIDNDGVSFAARFGGSPMEIYVPMGAVLGIYSRENGKGMFFEPSVELESSAQKSDQDQNAQQADSKSKDKEGKKGPSLKVIK